MQVTCCNCQSDKILAINLGNSIHRKYLCKACFSTGKIIDCVEFKEREKVDLQCSFCLDDNLNHNFYDLEDSQVCSDCLPRVIEKCGLCLTLLDGKIVHLDEDISALVCERCYDHDLLNEWRHDARLDREEKQRVSYT